MNRGKGSLLWLRGPLSERPFWTTPSPIAPTPTITAHSPYNWSSFLHGTSHVLTYCALSWRVSTVRTEAYTYAWKRSGTEPLFAELIHELIQSLSLRQSFNEEHFMPVLFTEHVLVSRLTNTVGLLQTVLYKMSKYVTRRHGRKPTAPEDSHQASQPKLAFLLPSAQGQ